MLLKKFVIGLLSVLSLMPVVSMAESQTTLDGVFNQLQVDRGEKLVAKYCAQCHDQSYFQDVFLQSWQFQTVQALYDEIQATMPRDQPGSLKDRQYAEVLAFIFSINDLPVGEEKLDYKNGGLEQITIRLP